MGDARIVHENGVRITIVNVADELEGWDKFDATAENTTGGPRTVNGTITLRRADGEPAGSCTVYLEVPPGEVVRDTFTAKVLDGPVTTWSFEVVRVYDF